MRDTERFKLRFGAYKTPRFRYGAVVMDAARGEVRIVKLSSGRIPWPIGRRGRSDSLVLVAALERTVRYESVQAVAHWWGVTGQTVTKWRRALGIVGQTTPGTSAVRSAYCQEDWSIEARRKA